MKRWLGLIPAKLVDREEIFLDQQNRRVTIQACSEGWTIIFADQSVLYEDVVDSTNNNYIKAYNMAISKLGVLKPYHSNLIEK